MEKNGSITLTPDDLACYNAGSVSDRLKALWGLSFEDLHKLFSENQVTVIGDEHNNKAIENESGKTDAAGQ